MDFVRGENRGVDTVDGNHDIREGGFLSHSAGRRALRVRTLAAAFNRRANASWG